MTYVRLPPEIWGYGTGPIGNDVLQQASAPSSPFYSQNCGGCGYTKLGYCRVNGECGIDSPD
jgi:hypothetical protein